MKPPIRFIGAGGAHDLHWGNSAALVEWAGKTYLIDCGFTVYPRLSEKKLIEQVDAVCITHLHDDHIGSLSVLLYHRHFLSKLPPLPLLVGGTELQAKLYTILHFMMGEVERFARIMTPEEYDPHLIWVSTSRQHMPHMPSAAYIFTKDREALIYTGDIAAPLPLLQDENWLSRYSTLYVFHDVAFHRTATHCYYEELHPFLEKVQLWGYHCDPTTAPADNKIRLVHYELML
ncbi:MAG: MBL fold metallo-hydrolase [Bacteroidia bacterium]|nr:MBL fold metallo-hydrolase [Bacteroidia bacterium]MDW8235253.1 MBL fold metallo-hydrolase [Bacteroidia bacterium]